MTWTHRNEIIFKGQKDNPITLLETAYYMFSYIMLYNKRLILFIRMFFQVTSCIGQKKKVF